MAKINGDKWAKSIQEKIKKLESEKNGKMPVVIANKIKNHFQDGFKQDGKKTDASRAGWKRKRKRKKDEGRNVLVGEGSGILRDDVKVKKETFEEVVVGTSAVTEDYSEVHNKGLGNHLKNEFIGESIVLKRNISRYSL